MATLWRAALMLMLLYRKLKTPIDAERALKMILIHDLVEAEAGDIPVFEITGDRKALKAQKERQAIEHIKNILGGELGKELYELWFEFEEAATPESKLAQFTDKIEAQIQHNESEMGSWLKTEKLRVFYALDKYAAFDPAMEAFLRLVKEEAFEKMRLSGENLDSLRGQARAAF